MTRKWFASIAFIFSFALCSLAAQAQAQAQSSVNATGNWSLTNSGDNFGTATASIKQVGSQIVGQFGQGGQFNGTFKAGTMQVDGNWKGPKGTGWITLIFVDNNSFSGDWGYNGRKPSGHIVATRIMQTFPPVSGRWDVRVTGGAVFLSNVITLHQTGQTVQGNIGSAAQLGGTIKPNTNDLDATWKGPRNSGWLKLTFAADSKSFEGTWGKTGDTTAQGNITGTINNKPQLWVRGLWYATYSGTAFAKGNLTFQQEGHTVIGTYQGGHMQGTLPIGSSKLTGTWKDARGAGAFQMTFSADGKSFQGVWVMKGKEAGRIIGKRAIASSPALRP
jgi:hypothetical protein